MDTRALVDPEILPILELLPPFDFSAEMLPIIREGFATQMTAPEIEGLPPTYASASGRDGAPDVPLVVFNPPSQNRKRAAILHIHGGGMVIGTAAMSASTFSPLAPALDIVVVSVDYRLAPETPFPGPQEDCYAGLEWLFANAESLGVDPARIAVMGESAGGGLAAALALMVRDRGEYTLCGQILIYPMIDHRTGGNACPYRNPTSGEFVWTRSSNRFGWESLQGGYGLDDRRIGWFSPTLAADLAGLAPAFIGVGTLDLFVDEDMDYARRLGAAGVPCELHTYPGAFHAFNMMATARVAQQAERDLHGGIKRLLGLAA